MLKDASDVLVNRVGRHEDHLRCESSSAPELSLLDCRIRPQCRLDGKRAPCLDVALHEALALLRYRAANVTRDRTVATEDLRATTTSFSLGFEKRVA